MGYINKPVLFRTKLDIYNVIEVQRMKVLLKDHQDLLTLFECMMKIINDRLNTEKTSTKRSDV
jgi:hypothetical protein